MTSVVNVLHLSDLHYWNEDSSGGFSHRSFAHHYMLERLGQIREESTKNNKLAVDDLEPHLVVISGDIAYTGDSEDYKIAKRQITELLEILDLTPDSVIVCPGNHDRNVRHALGLTYPRGAGESDQWLTPDALRTIKDRPAPLVVPFLDFSEFCEDMGFRKLEGFPGLDYLCGTCSVKIDSNRLEFLVLNSAWFASPDAEDIRNLWLGLPLLEQLYGIQLAKTAKTTEDTDIIRVGLCHHPREWLHAEEHDSYSDRPNTYRMFADQVDLILHGHVHGALESPSNAHNSAQTFTGGASYAGGRYRNNFSILQINFDDRSVRRVGYEYDPRGFVWESLSRANGTYALRPAANPRLAYRSDCDLSGSWQAIFWPEYSPSLAWVVNDLTLEPGGGNNTFQTVGAVGRGLQMRGEVFDGFFSGHWSDDAEESQQEQRRGTFQLKLLSHDRMIGRWLGTDRNDEIRVGIWQFKRNGSVE